MTPSATAVGWRFPRTFWVANVAELFERAAFYGMFIALARYLNQVIGFSDKSGNAIAGAFSCLLYFLPPFLGSLADKISYRRALIIAFSSLGIGYVMLGAFPTKVLSPISLLIIAFGGAIVKPVILGTASKCSDASTRARAFSIFYLMVNIGSFFGKTLAYPLRNGFHLPGYGQVVLGYVYINYYAAAMAFVALAVVFLAYRNPNTTGAGKPFNEVVRGFLRVIRNGRFMGLIAIVTGFWIIQTQLYASMPQYMERLIGRSANPEWLANINPFVVVLLVVPITHLVRNLKPVSSISISLAIIPCSALALAIAPILKSYAGEQIHLGWFVLHHVTVMAIIGIAIQGLAECFLSPKYLEFASRQAEPGEEGLYMGFQNLANAMSYLVGFVMAGFLIDSFCPDPKKLATDSPEQYLQWEAAMRGEGPLPAAYAQAHYIWYVFAGVGLLALLALLVFNRITSRQDRLREALTAPVR
ncbi:MAG: MFS transporter [Planctomycetes bacterium]|nr:MFS transporter [Planctomycetota bacterium]